MFLIDEKVQNPALEALKHASMMFTLKTLLKLKELTLPYHSVC